MHLKDLLFALANFVILFGALFLITRKRITRMFRERKEKIARVLEEAKQAEENAQNIEGQIQADTQQAQQQEESLLRDTRRQVEENSTAAAEDSQKAASVVRRSEYQKKRKDCGQAGNGTDASTGTGDA